MCAEPTGSRVQAIFLKMKCVPNQQALEQPFQTVSSGQPIPDSLFKTKTAAELCALQLFLLSAIPMKYRRTGIP